MSIKGLYKDMNLSFLLKNIIRQTSFSEGSFVSNIDLIDLNVDNISILKSETDFMSLLPN